MAMMGIALLFAVLAWVYLPRIAERLLNDAIADADLDHVELRVAKIGPGSAVLEAVSVADGTWAVEVDRVLVKYDLFDLLDGKIEEVVIEGMEAELALPDVKGARSDLKLMWIHDIPGVMEKLGKVRADGVGLSIERGGNSVVRVVDFEVTGHGGGRISSVVQAHDFKLGVDLQNTDMHAELALRMSDLRPDTFLSMLEVVLWLDQPLLPEGMRVAGAELTGGLSVDHGDLSPIELDGVMEAVVYDDGDKAVKLRAPEVKVDLSVELGGGGSLGMAGEMNEVSLSLDLDPAGLDLQQKKGEPTSWNMRVLWGHEPTKLTGELSGLDLSGKYDGKPVELQGLQMKIEMLGDTLQVSGDFSNGGIEIPLSYKHTMDDRGGSWKVEGEMDFGPVTHMDTLPGLRAAVDFFDDVSVAGKSFVSLDFSVGSDRAFEGEMIAKLIEGEVDVADGMLKATGVKGMYQMHLMPGGDPSQNNADDAQGGVDHHSLNLSVGKLEIASKESLGFDLVHDAESPLSIHAKGVLEGDGALLKGALSGLELYGHKDGCELHLTDTGLLFELVDGGLKAEGSLTMGGNEIPFSYMHELKDVDDGWKLTGCYEIEEAHLSRPVDNAVMFIEAMEGKTISGTVSVKMDFVLGSELDFEASLEAGIVDGTLVMGEDGPLIEGIEGKIKLESLEQKTTAGFHRVTAQEMTAFDVKMKDMGLDYQLLPDGDIKLRNIGLKAMDGEVSIDDFTVPGGDDDYAFKLRFRKLDVAQLAQLFPTFSGSISGSIDGLIPLEIKNGEVTPGRGGMYLTPKSIGKLRYDAGNSFSAGLDPKTEEYKRMKMVEQSLLDLDLKVLSVRLFDPDDGDKAVVLKLHGQAPSVEGSPPIHLNINGFKPDDETVDFFDLLLRHRDRLDFGL